MKRARRKAEREPPDSQARGAIVIEMALILPFLVILLVVIIDLGLMIRDHQVLQNAAREGARFSSLPQNRIGDCNPAASEGDIKQRVIDYLAEEGITVGSGDITVDQSATISVGALTLSASEVRVTFAHSVLLPGMPFLSAGTVTLTGRAVFQNLYDPC